MGRRLTCRESVRTVVVKTQAKRPSPRWTKSQALSNVRPTAIHWVPDINTCTTSASVEMSLRALTLYVSGIITTAVSATAGVGIDVNVGVGASVNVAVAVANGVVVGETVGVYVEEGGGVGDVLFVGVAVLMMAV